MTYITYAEALAELETHKVSCAVCLKYRRLDRMNFCPTQMHLSHVAFEAMKKETKNG